MENKEKRPFGMRDKIGYFMGDLGNDFTFLLSSSYLLKFYTDIMGVSAKVVGLVMMLARFVDAFTDVGMGRICDRCKVRPSGKFRPWILRMCGPVAIISFLMYQSSLANMGMAFKVAYLFVTYILWGSVFYTSINIPYGSMASAISAEPDDRQSLSSFRTMGGLVAMMVIMAGIPLVAYKTLADGTVVLVGSRFTFIAGVFSVLAIFAYLLCYSLTTERVIPEVDRERFESNTFGKMLGNAFRNRALLSIIAASVVMLLTQLTMQQMAGYIFPNYFRNAAAQSVSTACTAVGMIVAAAFVKPLSKRLGKAELSSYGNVVACVVGLVLLVMRPQNVWVFVVLQGLSWIALGFFSMVIWAMITDVIDDAEIQNGIREDGSVYALYSFARKLGQALAAGLSGMLLDMIGYSSETAFEPSVTEGIYNITVIVPAIGFLVLTLILMFWYPLHKRKVEENVQILKDRRLS